MHLSSVHAASFFPSAFLLGVTETRKPTTNAETANKFHCGLAITMCTVCQSNAAAYNELCYDHAKLRRKRVRASFFPVFFQCPTHGYHLYQGKYKCRKCILYKNSTQITYSSVFTGKHEVSQTYTFDSRPRTTST